MEKIEPVRCLDHARVERMPGKIDIPEGAALIYNVYRVRRFIALMLLALWLPATLHCDLEAAGVKGVLGCHDHDVPCNPHCTVDACHSIEGLSYQFDSSLTKAPQPSFILPVPPLALVAPTLVTVPREGKIEPAVAPPEVARTWHFVMRAAPPARAPAPAV